MVTASRIVPSGLSSIPKPEQLRADLKELYRQCRLTRRLLALSETVHTESGVSLLAPVGEQREVAHVG